MIIAISNGPIVPMLLSSRLISPKLLEVFSTSRFATLALHISAIHTELFQVVRLKRLILVLYLSEYVSAPTVRMVHMVLGGVRAVGQLGPVLSSGQSLRDSPVLCCYACTRAVRGVMAGTVGNAAFFMFCCIIMSCLINCP